MINLQNLHTHTTYSDGIDTPEQMIAYAIQKGFDSIGFSEHSCATYDGMVVYKTAICEMKKKYENEIKIFLGLEAEMYYDVDLSGYDYLIGSVHLLKVDNTYVSFDVTAQGVQKVIQDYFDNDGLKFARKYYEALAELPEHGAYDIIGHFDLLAKNNEALTFVDENSKAYFNAAVDAMEALKNKIPFFEVNTGGMARGYRSIPYPSLELLRELKRMNFGAVITSDCHDGRKLDYAFEEAREILAVCGFKERYILTDSGFKAVGL